MGRPPLGEDVVYLQVRIPRAERDRLNAAAATRGLSLGEWVRQVLGRAAQR